jgi:mRNA interferase MazF
MGKDSTDMPRVPLKRGDIVLVPFPFTDLTAEKLRPAVIVSPDPQELDVVIAFISSIVPSGDLAETDFLLSPDHPDFSKTGLKKASVFKLKKLLTIERTRLIRRLGRVSPAIQEELDRRLRNALGL